MPNYRRQRVMNCEEARLLMIPMWLGDYSVSKEEKLSFEVHLQDCQACTGEFEQTKQLMALAKEYWGPICGDKEKILDQAGYKIHKKVDPSGPLDVDKHWRDFCQLCPEVSDGDQKQKRGIFHYFLHISAAAACLVIGLSTWLILLKSHVTPERPLARQAAAAPDAFIKIELINPIGSELDAGKRISAENGLKELLINGKHRMVMNAGTSLTIESLPSENRSGCLVKLAAGEIYTHVEHDGNPFVIETNHGKAIITGTTFDIKVEDNNTRLVVTEGKVRFESEKGKVNVEAGMVSFIFEKSAPTNPQGCDTNRLITWASGVIPDPALATSKPFGQIFALPTPEGETIELDELNYDLWIRQRQAWFEREFPSIFELKIALNREGMDVDYPELLVRSGAMLQFHYPDDSQGRIAKIHSNSLDNVAEFYGYDHAWVMRNGINNCLSQTGGDVSISQTNIPAFDAWLDAISQKTSLDDTTLISSWHAAVYLLETRSLLWFLVKKDNFELTNQQREYLLEIIHKQVDAACASEGLIRKLYQSDSNNSICDKSQFNTLMNELAENIHVIRLFESEITKCILHKSYVPTKALSR